MTKWTTDYPKVAGPYWVKDPQYSKAFIYDLEFTPINKTVGYFDDDGDFVNMEGRGFKFYGPLLEPLE